MHDETVGEVVDKVQALGTYAYIDPNGQVWHMRYIGDCKVNPDGSWQPFKTSGGGPEISGSQSATGPSGKVGDEGV